MPDRLSALTRRFFPVGSGSHTVARSLGSIGRSSCTVALGPQDDLVRACVRVALLVVQTSERVASLGTAITQVSGMIAFLRHLESHFSARIAQLRHGLTVLARPLAGETASLMRDRVPTGRKIGVGSVLVVVRASLIAIARGLVVIRPGLILIARRLVAIRRCLITIG